MQSAGICAILVVNLLIAKSMLLHFVSAAMHNKTPSECDSCNGAQCQNPKVPRPTAAMNHVFTWIGQSGPLEVILNQPAMCFWRGEAVCHPDSPVSEEDS